MGELSKDRAAVRALAERRLREAGDEAVAFLELALTCDRGTIDYAPSVEDKAAAKLFKAKHPKNKRGLLAYEQVFLAGAWLPNPPRLADLLVRDGHLTATEAAQLRAELAAEAGPDAASG
jgi:hypothetical protein